VCVARRIFSGIDAGGATECFGGSGGDIERGGDGDLVRPGGVMLRGKRPGGVTVRPPIGGFGGGITFSFGGGGFGFGTCADCAMGGGEMAPSVALGGGCGLPASDVFFFFFFSSFGCSCGFTPDGGEMFIFGGGFGCGNVGACGGGGWGGGEIELPPPRSGGGETDRSIGGACGELDRYGNAFFSLLLFPRKNKKALVPRSAEMCTGIAQVNNT
jgi:hypothetical protein